MLNRLVHQMLFTQLRSDCGRRAHPHTAGAPESKNFASHQQKNKQNKNKFPDDHAVTTCGRCYKAHNTKWPVRQTKYRGCPHGADPKMSKCAKLKKKGTLVTLPSLVPGAAPKQPDHQISSPQTSAKPPTSRRYPTGCPYLSSQRLPRRVVSFCLPIIIFADLGFDFHFDFFFSDTTLKPTL